MIKKETIFIYLAFTAIAIIFLYLISFSTSSLYPYSGYDSAYFQLLGKAIISGKLLYVDIFDHKGPFIFFINAIGIGLAGVKGIFLLQTINLTLIQVLIYKISRLFRLSNKSFIILLSSSLIFLSATFDDGNMTEEYSLVPILLCLYLSLKYAFSSENAHPLKYAFIYGCNIAFLFLMRMTNSATICGIVLAIFIVLLIKKEWSNLIKNIIVFIFGFGLIFGATSLYFVLYNAFDDFIYGTFTFNMMYAKTFMGGIQGSPIKEFVKATLRYIPLFLAIAMSVFHYINTRNIKLALIVFTCSITTIIATNIGLNAFHYIMLNLPIVVISISLLLKVSTNSTKWIKLGSYSIISMFAVVCLASTYNLVYVYQLSRDKSLLYNNYSYTVDTDLVNTLIKEEDRNSVFGYNLASNWYLATDILPPFKYYTNQEAWSRTDKKILDSLNEYLLQTPPKWIVIPKPHKVYNTTGVDGNSTLKTLLSEKYSLKGEDINHWYYTRENTVNETSNINNSL